MAPRTWCGALYPEEWTPELVDVEGRMLHDFYFVGCRTVEVESRTLAPPVVLALDDVADIAGLADSPAGIQAALGKLDTVAFAGGGSTTLLADRAVLPA